MALQYRLWNIENKSNPVGEIDTVTNASVDGLAQITAGPQAFYVAIGDSGNDTEILAITIAGDAISEPFQSGPIGSAGDGAAIAAVVGNEGPRQRV